MHTSSTLEPLRNIQLQNEKRSTFPPTRSPFPCPPPPPESEVSERLHLRQSLFFISSGGGKEEKKSKKPRFYSYSSCQSEFTFALKAPCEKVILVFPPFLLFWPEGQGGEKERGPPPTFDSIPSSSSQDVWRDSHLDIPAPSPSVVPRWVAGASSAIRSRPRISDECQRYVAPAPGKELRKQL